MPDRWDLSHLLKDPGQEFDIYIQRLEAQVSQFEALRPQLHPDMPADRFREVVRFSERIAEDSARLSAYAYLWFAENTKDPEARAFKAKVEERLTALQNRLLFFELWWQSVDERNAGRLMAEAGDLRYYLESIRRYTPHTLSEPEEKILNLKNTTGRNALTTLYDILTNGLTFSLKVRSKRKTITREELSSYFRSPEGSVREAAYKELFRGFSSHRDLIAEIYTSLVNDWKSESMDLRRFRSPLASRNLSNDIPDEAVDALLSVCRKNTAVFQEYFELKGRILRIKRMSRYHIYAPHRSDRKRYRFRDAVSMLLEAYRSFSPRMAELAERVVTARHLDTPSRPGKLSGAFCYSVVPRFTPYVLLNYTGEARDVATLAHELGHAVHAMLAESHSVFTFHATLPLAETASVFGERLLSEALIAEERSQSVKQALLLSQLDDLYATIMRQAYFVLFEKQAHELIAKGATLDDLGTLYLGNLREQFGKAVMVPDEFQWEWLTIPHLFSSPFYCYAYSFGNLLVLALYQSYKREGPSFIPRYLDLLAAGGSRSPEGLLSEVGVDMRSEAFWQSGFQTIRELLAEVANTRS